MNDQYKHSRTAYIFEAAFEYFITIIISGAYLANLLTRTGISDSLAGILSSFVSLACSAQFFSVLFIRTVKPVKRWVTLITMLKLLLFVGLYCVPVMQVSQTIKTLLVILFLLGGQLVANIAAPFKTNWLMSLVDNKHRGLFTATKEQFSLIGGMLFSYLMGLISDHYNELGNADMAFKVCRITLVILGLFHLATLLIAKEPAKESKPTQAVLLTDAISCTFGNSTVRKLILLNVLWSGFTWFSRSYFGTYEIKELGFSLTYVSVISMVSSFARILVSKYFGKLADKTSWANMMTICFGIAAVGFFVQSFTAPENGKVFFLLYSVLYSLSLAGINGGLINIVFDYVDETDRTAVLGIKTAIGGVCGFLASILGGKLLEAIQAGGNTFLGINVYAQQVLSFITFLGILLILVYMKRTVLKLKRVNT